MSEKERHSKKSDVREHGKEITKELKPEIPCPCKQVVNIDHANTS